MDPSYSRATDPDMAFGSSLGPVDILAVSGRTIHSGGNSCRPNLGTLCDLWWKYRNWISEHVPAVVGP